MQHIFFLKSQFPNRTCSCQGLLCTDGGAREDSVTSLPFYLWGFLSTFNRNYETFKGISVSGFFNLVAPRPHSPHGDKAMLVPKSFSAPAPHNTPFLTGHLIQVGSEVTTPSPSSPLLTCPMSSLCLHCSQLPGLEGHHPLSSRFTPILPSSGLYSLPSLSHKAFWLLQFHPSLPPPSSSRRHTFWHVENIKP